MSRIKAHNHNWRDVMGFWGGWDRTPHAYLCSMPLLNHNPFLPLICPFIHPRMTFTWDRHCVPKIPVIINSPYCCAPTFIPEHSPYLTFLKCCLNRPPTRLVCTWCICIYKGWHSLPLVIAHHRRRSSSNTVFALVCMCVRIHLSAPFGKYPMNH